MINSNNEAECKELSPLLETSLEGFVSDVRSSLGLVNRFNQATQGVGKVEIRFVEFVPTLSLVVVDGRLSNGHIVVELLPYQVDPASRPHLIFRASENPSWFVYFREIAERIWRDAKPYRAS